MVSTEEPPDAMGGKMAAIFLLLAVADAALLGNLVLANPNAGSVSVLDRSVTGFTQGQLLLLAAGLGLLLGLLVAVAWSSSIARRLKDRQLRAARREVQSRVARLERDNARLRQQLQDVQPTGQLVGSRAASSQAP
jgi:cell shape-determining protein MreC